MARNEAAFLSVNCVRTHKKFYARYDFAYDGVWVLTYGLKDKPFDIISRDDSINVTQIDLSNSRTGPQYRCPYCGNVGFVRCSQCGNLTCHSGNGDFVCDHCGNMGIVSGTIDSLEGNRSYSQK